MKVAIALYTAVVLVLCPFPVLAQQLPSSTPIYAIKTSGDMLFYKYAGAADGSSNWAIQAKKIGNGWDFKQVFAGR